MNNNSVYIIAEVGINHNGVLENCYGMIDAAVDAGCNAVKFQFFRAASLYPRSAGKLDWKDGEKKYSYDIYRAVETFELPAHWIDELFNYCHKRKIDFLSSVFDYNGIRYLINRGMKIIKLASYSVTNLPLIEFCARFNVPVIMSTGGATLGEIEDAVKVVNRYHNKLSLLHCSIKYPTELHECNLGVIKTLRYAFPDNAIGYSDHTQEISIAPVQAVYLGAQIIEKHITLDKTMKGPDHFFALEPRELRSMVDAIRKAEKVVAKGAVRINREVYGTSQKLVFKHEQYSRNFCYNTIFARKSFKKGERINCRDLLILRPGKKKRGLDPQYLSLFKHHKIRAAQDIAREEAISWRKILNA